MLTRIEERNFQRHKKLLVDVKEPILCITGPNDRGKTAILRSLYWIAKNRPTGSHFIRKGSDFAKSKIWIDDSTISRRKGKKGNLYSLDGKKFKAVAGKVPEEINKKLNLDDVNFQFQMEPVFWLALSPGELSQELNKITNLDIIDRILSIVSKESRRKKTEIEIINDRLKTAKEKEKSLEWVVVCYKEFNKLDKQSKKIEETQDKKNKLKSVLIKIKEWRKKLNIEFPNDLVSLLKKQKKEIDELGLKIKTLTAHLEKIKSARKRKCQMEQLVLKYEEKLKKIKRCPVCKRPTKKKLPS